MLPSSLLLVSIFLRITNAASFTATGLAGFDIEIDIGESDTSVHVKIDADQSLLWCGLGFGTQMNNTYAIIQSLGTLSEYKLAHHAVGQVLDATASSWNVELLSFDAAMQLQFTRANELDTPNYYAFDPDASSLDVIYAIGGTANYSQGIAHTAFRQETIAMDPTLSPTAATTTTTTSASTTTSTLTDEADDDSFAAGILGFLQRVQTWINTQATLMQKLFVCLGFALLLVCCLVCCYMYQCRKTRTLRKTLYSFNPEMLQNERAKAKAQKYGDVPFINGDDPGDPDVESSLGNGRAEEEFIPPSHQEAAHIQPPDDEEANFRRPNPNASAMVDDLETSVSLQLHEQPEALPPPPPSEPIPDDILEQHRPKLQLSARGNHLLAGGAGAGHMPVNSSSVSSVQVDDTPVNRRATYDAGVQPQVELQSYRPVQALPPMVVPLAGIERVATQSQVVSDDDEEDAPPTPVSDDNYGDNNVLDMLTSADVLTAAPSMEQKYTDKKKNIRSHNMNVHSMSSMNDDQEDQDGDRDRVAQAQNPALQMISQALGVLPDGEPLAAAAAADSDSDETELQVPLINAEDGEGGKAAGDAESESDMIAPAEISEIAVADRKQTNQSETDPFGGIGALDFGNMAPKTEIPVVSAQNADPFGGIGSMDFGKMDQAAQSAPQKQLASAQKQKRDSAFVGSLDMGGGAVLYHGLGASAATQSEQPLQSGQPPALLGLGFVDELMSANPEFGNNENIFGGGVHGDTDHVNAIISAAGRASNIVDFQKFANVPEVEKIDYSKLTKIEDADQFKVMSVEETVVVDDGDGNVHQSTYQQIGASAPPNELDAILDNNMQDPAHNVQVLMPADQSAPPRQNALHASPLDAIMAQSVPQVSSPLDAMIAEAAAHSSQPQQSIPTRNEQWSSPLDDIMAHSEQPQSNDDVDDNTANHTASPLDALMAAAESKDPEAESNHVAAEIYHNRVASPLDAIMASAADYSSSEAPEMDVPVIHAQSNSDDQLDEPVVFPPAANGGDAEPKQQLNVADDNESVGSEIIHASPRNSEKQEKLDPALFGNTEDSSTSSSDEEENSIGTDPNVY